LGDAITLYLIPHSALFASLAFDCSSRLFRLPVYFTPMSEVQLYDICMALVLIACIAVGVWKGMAWQLAALASVFLSGFVAVGGATALAPYFNVDSQWNHVLAMLVLYVVTAGAIWIVFRLISKIIERVQLKEFDRQLGAIFGLAKGIVYCILLTFFIVTLWEPGRQVVLQSRSGQYISRAIHRANPILPSNVRALLGKYIDELDQKLTPPQGVSPQGVPPTLQATQAAMVPVVGGAVPNGTIPGGTVPNNGPPSENKPALELFR
jgi:membrane protein required for colicin V production